MKTKTAVDKINEDLPGAAENWGLLFDQWVFLHNQFKGLSPDIAKHLISIDGQYGKKICQWSESQVEELVDERREGDLQAVFGFLPDFRNLAAVTISDISTVVLAVAQQIPASESIAPVPGDKLDANGLSDDVKELLRAGTQKSRNVRDLFEKWHDPELGDRVAAAFRKRYDEVKAAGMEPDEIFRSSGHLQAGADILTQQRSAQPYRYSHSSSSNVTFLRRQGVRADDFADEATAAGPDPLIHRRAGARASQNPGHSLPHPDQLKRQRDPLLGYRDISYDWFVLTLSFLFSAGAIELSRGRLRRAQ